MGGQEGGAPPDEEDPGTEGPTAPLVATRDEAGAEPGSEPPAPEAPAPEEVGVNFSGLARPAPHL